MHTGALMNSAQTHRRLGPVLGRVSLVAGLLSFGTVLCFLLPGVLTTPALRESYPLGLVRIALGAVMIIAVASGLFALFASRRVAGAAGAAFAILAQVLGGIAVPLADMTDSPIVLGLDWLLVDGLVLAAVFIPLEKWLPNRKTPFRRKAWRTDLTYFIVNHLGMHLFAVVTTAVAAYVCNWVPTDSVRLAIRHLPVGVQVLGAFLVVDLLQYWVHRGYHQLKLLWPLHAVHHSSEHMDALAGSRVHFLESLFTRTVLYAALQLSGISFEAFAIFGSIAALHATLIHSNLRLPWGPLRYLIVTPEYHHWHHSSDSEAIDKNYAGYFPVIDLVFGTYHFPKARWPERYGVVNDRVPRGLLAQAVYPFACAVERFRSSKATVIER